MDTESFEHRKLIQRREQSVQVLFDELDNTELDGCKFLCEPYIASASLEDIRNGSELVILLARKKKIDFEQPHFDFLVELLYRVHRLDLVMNLGLSADNVRTKYGNIQHTNMIAFRCLLLSLSYDLTNKNLEAILEILRSDDDIGIGRLSRIKTVLDLFRLLMKEVKLKHDDFQQLTQIVDLIGRQDLLSKIRHHEDKSRRAITLHASIDSMRSSYCNDTGRKAYQDKETVFIMENPLVFKYSKQFTCVKEMYPHKECSSPLPSLQGFINVSSLLGKQHGEETPAKQSPNLTSQKSVASIEHFEWFSSSSIRDQDGKETQEVASPEQIVSLPPQRASFLGYFERSNCDDTKVRDQMDREVLSEMACVLKEPQLSTSEKLKDRKESEGITPMEPVLSLPTQGATSLRYTEDLSSGYVSSERDKQLPRPPPVDMYTMSAEPRGKCLVVNNQTFKNAQGRTHERTGSNIDAGRLMKTFSSLKFETELCNNLSALELVRLLSETGNKDHTNFDCFVLCVLTHGSKGQVIGRDWEPVDIEELTKYLQSSYCRSLAGKPKIIIIQACQGKKRQLCGDVEEDIVPFAAQVVRPTTNTRYHGDTADFVIVNSTCPGYSSLRSPRDGAFFIQTLADALDQHAQRWDFMTILEDVNKKMSRRITRKDGRDYIQTPSLHSTLTAKIYFI